MVMTTRGVACIALLLAGRAYGVTNYKEAMDAHRRAKDTEQPRARGTHAHESAHRENPRKHTRDHTRRPQRPCTTAACVEASLPAIERCWAPFAHRPVTFRPEAAARRVAPEAVAISGALGDGDVLALGALADCVTRFAPDRKPRERPHADDDGAALAWDVGWFLKSVAPELRDRVVEVASLASRAGDTPAFARDAASLHIRSVERIRYRRAGHLDLHVDRNSTYTLVLLLSNAASFGGGHFFARAGGADLDLALDNHGGVLCLSDAPHGVTHVTRGKRDVLAVEFWSHHEPLSNETRPDPVAAAAPGAAPDSPAGEGRGEL